MTYKNKNRQFKDATNFAFEIVKESKIKVIIFSVIALITLLTGIIVAAKTHSSYENLSSYGIVDVRTGTLTTTFFSRLLSILFLTLIMFGCSFSPYLFPLAILFIAYRAYLLGLNICLMIIFYGLSGVILSIIIAFPCQLLILCVLALFYIMLAKTAKDYKCFGGCKVPKQRTKIVLLALFALFVICIAESLLLTLFSAKFILVI